MDVSGPISTLPRRAGPPPRTSSVMPHQQLDQHADPALGDEIVARGAALEGVRVGPSTVSIEGARALFVDGAGGAAARPDAFITGTEFAHVHPEPDRSLHLSLPHDIADAVVAAGWAEFHPLACTADIPGSVVMVYAPRDAEEADVVWRIVRASYDHARGS